MKQNLQSSKRDDFIKSPDAALHCILRRCGVRKVRLTPQALHALPANFLRSRQNFNFLQVYQTIKEVGYGTKFTDGTKPVFRDNTEGN